MERHQHAVVKQFPFGAGLGISFSQTRASHNKRDGFGRERASFGDVTISVASYSFQKISSVNIEQQECCVQFWNFRGSFGHFYILTWSPRHFMRIIQIWLHAHAPVHINGLKNQMCPWYMLRSHARNGNECHTPCHRHSAANIEIPGF